MNFGLPAEVGGLADVILRELPGLGFGSRTDVIKAAIREYYLRLVEDRVLPPNVFVEDTIKRKKLLPAEAEVRT
jgi:hypothetical protein